MDKEIKDIKKAIGILVAMQANSMDLFSNKEYLLMWLNFEFLKDVKYD